MKKKNLFDWRPKHLMPNWLKTSSGSSERKTVPFDEQIVNNQQALILMRRNFAPWELELTEALVTALSQARKKEIDIPADVIGLIYDRYAAYQSMEDALALQTDVIHQLATEQKRSGKLPRTFNLDRFDTTKLTITDFSADMITQRQKKESFENILAITAMTTMRSQVMGRIGSTKTDEVYFTLNY